MQILGKAGIFIHAVGKQKSAQEKEQSRIADHEEIDLEGPDLDALQAEFEPPKVDDGEGRKNAQARWTR